MTYPYEEPIPEEQLLPNISRKKLFLLIHKHEKLITYKSNRDFKKKD